MTTKFSDKFKTKTDSDLLQIIENTSSYQREAVLTAISELESRGIVNEDIISCKNKIQSQIQLENQNQQLTVESKIPTDLPNTISNSAKAIYLSAAIGIINPILVNLLTEIDNFSNPTNLVIILVSTGILAFLGYDISLGKNWARIVFTILCGLGFLMVPFIIPDTFRLNPIIGVLSLFQAILQGFAIFLLFKSESRNWYKKQKEKPNKNTAHNNI